MPQEKKATGARTPDVKPESSELYEAAVDHGAPLSNPFLDLFCKAFPPNKEDEHRQQQQFIEVGCGPGKFTLKNIFPTLPPCRRLVALDKSEDMIKLASDKYSHPRIQYLELDILGDVDKFVQEQGQFERLYSFHMLHWIRDQRLAMRNFEKLMAHGGECLVVFLRNLPFHDLFDEMMKYPQWSKYSQVLQDHIPETCKIPDVISLREYASNLVISTKLVPLTSEVFAVPPPGVQSKKGMIEMLLSFNPVYTRINNEEKQELLKFTEDFVDAVFAKNGAENFGGIKVIVIHAFKPLK